MIFTTVKIFTFMFLVGLVRRPYIKAQLLSQKEAEKQVQEDEVAELLTKIDIKLASYPEDYFVIVSASFNPESTLLLSRRRRTQAEAEDSFRVQ